MANFNDMNRFDRVQTSVGISRSKFGRPFSHKTTFNAGDLTILSCDMVLPGDTLKRKNGIVLRMSTPKVPVMDNAFLDVFHFFVPWRQIWDDTDKFFGDYGVSYWTTPTEIYMPQLTVGTNAVAKGSVLEKLGLPIGYKNAYTATTKHISALPVRAYCHIWNEWFRNENLMQPCNITKSSIGVSYNGKGDSTPFYSRVNPSEWVTEGQLGGTPLPVCKIKDYFTSLLPGPQKGNAVNVVLSGLAPVITSTNTHLTAGAPALKWQVSTGTPVVGSTSVTLGIDSSAQSVTHTGASGTNGSAVAPSNLYADLSAMTAFNINDIRMAFAMQRLLEKDARGGTRMVEMLAMHYGVYSSDANYVRPEYLGGTRIPITMSQVLQTSETGTTPQGNASGFSLTVDNNFGFTKSFTEFGYVMTLCCVRTHQTYSQGVPRWLRAYRRYDVYDPVFANISEQPVYQDEIFVPSTGEPSTRTVLGFSEAWSDYRYKPWQLSGEFSPNYATPLDYWHYGDDFGSAPTLSAKFLMQNREVIDQTLSIGSTSADQFKIDCYFDDEWVRPMPVYSIPGLLDHA